MRIKAIIYLIFTLLASVIVVETCFFSERFRDNKFKCEVVAGSLDILEDDEYMLRQPLNDRYTMISNKGIDDDFSIKNKNIYVNENFMDDNESFIDIRENKKTKEIIDLRDKKYEQIYNSTYDFSSINSPQYFNFNFFDNNDLFGITFNLYEASNISVTYHNGDKAIEKTFYIDIPKEFSKESMFSFSNYDFSLENGIISGAIAFEGNNNILLLELNLEEGSSEVLVYPNKDKIDEVKVNKDTLYIKTADYDGDYYSIIKKVSKKDFKEENTLLGRSKLDLVENDSFYIERDEWNHIDRRYELVNLYADESKFIGEQNVIGQVDTTYTGKADISYIDIDAGVEKIYKDIYIVDETDVVDGLRINDVFTSGKYLISSYSVEPYYLIDGTSYIRVLNLETGEIALKLRGNFGVVGISRKL